MAYMLSPGVRSIEIDLTGIIPSVATTEGAYVGAFHWGPISDRVLIESEQELVETFWKPTSAVANDWYTASNFLAYSNALWQVRVADTTNANTSLRVSNSAADPSYTPHIIKNNKEYFDKYDDGSLDILYTTGPWISKFGGKIGNSLKVSLCAGGTAFNRTLTGTLSVSAGGTAVTGTGTTFSTQVIVGDVLIINNESHVVSAIASNTALTLKTKHIKGASANTSKRYWQYYNEVSGAPGTSTYVAARGGLNDEVHVAVIDEDGEWTGVKGEILEVYGNVSVAYDAQTDDGESNYYKDVINRKSRYIRWASHPDGLTNAGSLAQAITFVDTDTVLSWSLAGGSDGTTIGNDERTFGYDLFLDPEEVDISIVLGGAADSVLANYIIQNIVEKRQDCVAVLSPPKEYVVDNLGEEAEAVVDYRNTLPSTSWAILDSGWKLQYDRYNDLNRYVPLNGDIAGLMVRTDYERDAWWAPAGLNRGHIKNVVKLAWSPSQTDRDYLYKNGVNPVIHIKGEGPVLWGQKTLYSKPSAFDRLNVRRLFIVLRKAISKAARYYLFEFNDEITRTNFKNMVEPFLRDIKGRRGVYDFLVVCDERNNPPVVIDRNEFVASIYIKPTRVAEFITLNFVAVPTGAVFSEIVGAGLGL